MPPSGRALLENLEDASGRISDFERVARRLMAGHAPTPPVGGRHAFGVHEAGLEQPVEDLPERRAGLDSGGPACGLGEGAIVESQDIVGIEDRDRRAQPVEREIELPLGGACTFSGGDLIRYLVRRSAIAAETAVRANDRPAGKRDRPNLPVFGRFPYAEIAEGQMRFHEGHLGCGLRSVDRMARQLPQTSADIPHRLLGRPSDERFGKIREAKVGILLPQPVRRRRGEVDQLFARDFEFARFLRELGIAQDRVSHDPCRAAIAGKCAVPVVDRPAGSRKPDAPAVGELAADQEIPERAPLVHVGEMPRPDDRIGAVRTDVQPRLPDIVPFHETCSR